jgi:hypothetical protein
VEAITGFWEKEKKNITMELEENKMVSEVQRQIPCFDFLQTIGFVVFSKQPLASLLTLLALFTSQLPLLTLLEELSLSLSLSEKHLSLL